MKHAINQSVSQSVTYIVNQSFSLSKIAHTQCDQSSNKNWRCNTRM